MNVNTTNLTSFITATAAAIGAGFVAFGHSSLSSPAQAAFVGVAGLVVAVIHNGLIKSGTGATISVSKTPNTGA